MTKPPTPEQVRLPGDGLSLVADAWGDPGAPPVLFFHGGGQGRGSWRGAARAVAAAGYRGFSVDLRGHGDSGWADDGDYILDAYARDVERLLQVFERPAALVGASRGGQAALVGGSRHPDRVSLIMLADVGPRISTSGVAPIKRFLHRSLEGFATVDEAADALAELWNKPHVADASGLARVMWTNAEGRLVWRWDPRSVSPEYLNPASETALIEAAAARVRGPVVLVKAEHSELLTEEGVALFRRLTPQLIVTEAQGVGHMFTGDQNDAFADQLLGHLKTFAPLP